jgi:peptide/nickel transport system substrate-binding protein
MEKCKAKGFFKFSMGILITLFALMPYAAGSPSMAAEKPQYGGTLTQVVGADLPSYDGHQEYTYSVLYATAPHYNLLLKFDPDNYPKIIGDLAESWTISKDQKAYTFKIHKGVKFHDGSLLTARDVKASYDHFIFPPQGVVSTRKAFYSMVEKVEAPDDRTVVFHLKWPAASFLGSLASPWNFIYKAEILAKDPQWYKKNVMGSGPFKFVEHVAGAYWAGKRNEDYFVKGRPYLDGFRVVFIRDRGTRAATIRGGRVHADFRGEITPGQRDEIVRALGDKIQVQETNLITATTTLFNTEQKPFNDPRVRRALTLAVDRWAGSKTLQKISNEKDVGGLLRPGSEFAMSEAELTKVAGFSKDIAASRKEARRLLREAGVPEGFSFELIRPPTPNYEPQAIFFIDQWRQVGLNVTQKGQEWGLHDADLRKGTYKVAFSAIAGFMDEPDLQFIIFLSADKSPRNFGRYTDRVLDDLYERQSRTMDPVERKKLCHQFEKRVLDEMAYVFPVLWSTRNVMLSSKVKGWRGLPNAYLNQDLANVWMEKD